MKILKNEFEKKSKYKVPTNYEIPAIKIPSKWPFL